LGNHKLRPARHGDCVPGRAVDSQSGAGYELFQREQDLHHTHQKPIPRLGGLALAAAFVGLEVFIAVIFPEERAKIPGMGRPVVLVSSLAMFALGFWG